MISSVTNSKLNYACKIIYGPLFKITPETFSYLKLSGIKSAYRKKVKFYHPDMSKTTGKDVNELTEEFKKITEAYNFLIKVLSINNSFKFSISQQTKHKREKSFYESKNRKDHFYTGVTPKRTLRFGEYLYYNKKITWHSLIDAIIWQYRQRPKIGHLLKKSNVLNNNKIVLILKDIRNGERFGNAALRKGLISKEQLNEHLAIQRRMNLPLGRHFIETNKFSKKELYSYLNAQLKHNVSMKNKY